MMDSAVEPNDAIGSLATKHFDRSCKIHHRREDRDKLRTSRFETTSSFLLALMMIVTCGVMILLMKYLTLQAEGLECRFPLVELGLIGEQVDYVFDLSTLQKRRNRPLGDEETRMYFVFTGPTPLQRYDSQLVSQAGIRVGGRMQVKFISNDLEDQLALIELEHAMANDHGDVSEIAKTIFGSVSLGEKYEFQVISQRYRR